jgi:hypothetical protein
MIHHVAVVTPKNRRRYAEAFKGIGLPKISLPSARDIDRFYRAEGLKRA